MSKGRVWNKGKRDGGGGPAPGTGFKEKAKQTASDSAAEKAPLIPPVDLSDPKNQVKPMKRDNWVTRPVRVKPSESEQQN
ncbi:hypothetical protein ACFPYJ_14370 [Paenibacillus solisilvae]|uniref:Uncharacterized protein n=1 Tax=Paenibacillus solisilvae TaxID=2486751 RepID=A0ABW0VWP4_9BACL